MYVLLIVYLYRVIISTIVDDIFGLKSTCTTIGIFALFMHDNFKRCFLWLRGHCVCATVHTRVTERHVYGQVGGAYIHYVMLFTESYLLSLSGV